MVRSFLDTRLFNAFMLSYPTNPAETYGRYLYEDYHHQPLTQEEVESLASLPYVDFVDKRYMTAGVSTDYVRLDTYREFFSNSDRCVIEATVLKSSINEEWAQSVKLSNGKNNNYSAVYDYTLSDVTMLAGDPQWLETQLNQYSTLY